MSPCDKLYYHFVQGTKDAKKLYQTMTDMFNLMGNRGTKDAFETIVALSKRLTENAYFAEAKLFNQLASSEYQNSFQVQEEAARVAFIFEDYKNCIELNRKGLNLRNAAGQVGGLLDGNWTNIGLAYYELQDYNESLNALQQALHFNPNCAPALINLALVHKKLGQFEKAIAVLENVLKIDPRDAAAYINLANILHEQGRQEQAAVYYLQALEIEPNDDDALCNLGMVLQRINYHDFAKVAFEEGIHINPGNQALLHNYMLFLLEIKQFDKFTTVLNHAKRVLDSADIAQLQKLQ